MVKVRVGMNLNPHLVPHLNDSSLTLIHLNMFTQAMPPRVWTMGVWGYVLLGCYTDQVEVSLTSFMWRGSHRI